MQDIKLTLIQSNLHWEDIPKNLSMFSDKIKSIGEATDIIILPEMFSTGFTMNAQAMAEEMDGQSIQWMNDVAKEYNCVVTGSLIIREGGRYFNRLVWMRPDGYDHYDKRHLFSLAQEERTYTPGKRKIISTVKGWKVMPLICYDLRFPVWSRRTKQYDYDLLIYVASWPQRRVNAWKQLLIARAIENQCFVAGLNRTGNDGNEFLYTGESAVIDFRGDYIGGMPEQSEFIRTFALSQEELVDYRKNFSFFADGDAFDIRY